MTDFDATNALAWIWNPHRAPLGLGNYDVNVLVFVLQQKGYVLDWLDKRQDIDENLIRFDEVEGILCNIVMSTTFRRLWTQRHWFAIRKIDGVCYNLDSKLDVPMPFDSDTACYEFLQELVNTGECELFSLKREALQSKDSPE